MYAKVRAALAALGLIIILIIGEHQISAAVFDVFRIGADTTDGRYDRSGMALFVDHGTGCEYLGSPFGGITPRLSFDGKQICNRKYP